MKLVLILVDAMKSSYLNKECTPFLFNLCKNGQYVKQVIPSPGFCERSEIFTGLDCYETANFTALGYNPRNGAYANENFALFLIKIVSFFSEKIARLILNKFRIFRGINMNSYRIPLKCLNKFVLTEDGDTKYIKYKTLFEQLDDSNMTYTMEFFTSLSSMKKLSNNKSLIDRLESEINKGTDFIPVYLGELDAAGHKFGIDFDSIKPSLINVDTVINNMYKIFTDKSYSLIVLGDHGMVPIIKNVDILDVLKKNGVKNSKNLLVFLDSTYARFWSNDEHLLSEIGSILEREFKDDGIIVNKENFNMYGIPLDIKNSEDSYLYGDLVWCANPGILISPDYFNDIKPSCSGMHGYLQTDMHHGTGVLISSEKVSSQSTDTIRLKDVCFEICSILDIPQPNPSNWERQPI